MALTVVLQTERVYDMRRERRIQWLKGIAGAGPKINYAEETPPQDGYVGDHYYDD